MKQIGQLAEAAEKGALQFGGTISNISWSAEEIGRMIDRGSFFLEEIPAGRLWFHRAEGRNQFCFQVAEDGADRIRPEDLPIGNAVSELIYTEAQARKKDPERAILSRLGMTRESTALFMACAKKEDAPPEGGRHRCEPAEPADLEALEALYGACFDRLTDAVPDRRELSEAVDGGMIRVIRGARREILGTIMVQCSPRRRLIRHVAVAPACRRQGIGTELAGAALAEMAPGERAFLWVRGENGNALRLYERMGFVPQARKMEIWVKR